jgi:hypothetical protein
MNAVEILYTQYENGKMRPVETNPEMGGEETKDNDVGDEFNHDTL